MRRISIILTITLAILSCESENYPPQIIDITCSDSDWEVISGDRVILECLAMDPEGDPISYVWGASTGTFSSTSGPSVTWTAPQTNLGSVAQIGVRAWDSENPEGDHDICWIIFEPVPEGPDPEALNYIKYVSDDVYVDQGHPDTNYGDEPFLSTGPGYFTFLKFDISDVDNYINMSNLSSVEKAEVWLATGYNNTATKPEGTTEIYGISWSESSWYEEWITYNTRPKHESKITEVENITFDTDGVVKFDVTKDFLDRVQLHNNYSVMLSTPYPSISSGCYFYSKELKDHYPSYGDAATPVLVVRYLPD